MNIEPTAVIPFATKRAASRVVDGRIEFTFNNASELYAFLAREMAMKKVKYSKFAEKAELCASTVSKMAHGETQYPRFATVFALLKVLGYELVVK